MPLLTACSRRPHSAKNDTTGADALGRPLARGQLALRSSPIVPVFDSFLPGLACQIVRVAVDDLPQSGWPVPDSEILPGELPPRLAGPGPRDGSWQGRSLMVRSTEVTGMPSCSIKSSGERSARCNTTQPGFSRRRRAPLGMGDVDFLRLTSEIPKTRSPVSWDKAIPLRTLAGLRPEDGLAYWASRSGG